MIKLKENKHELDSCILSTFLKLSTVTLQLVVWLRVACCYVLPQIYWLHQLHQTSKFASGSKMYIF